MRISTLTSSLLALAFLASPAFADDQHDHGRDRTHQRDRSYDRGHAVHGAQMRDPRQRGGFRSDHRSYEGIRNDPHFRISVNGYRPQHQWRRYHLSRGAWFRSFGIRTWVGVGAITCEAVNQDTGQMYPVSVPQSVNENSANLALDQALDNCYADGGGGACAPIQPACSIQR